MKHWRNLVPAAGLLLAVAVSASAREWTDNTGTYKTEADLVEVRGNQVVRAGDQNVLRAGRHVTQFKGRALCRRHPQQAAVVAADVEAPGCWPGVVAR